MEMLMTKKNNTPKEILDLIKSSEKIGVISHKNPDGDNIGSTIATVLGIRENLNKNIFGIKVDYFPKDLMFLDTLKNIEEIDEQDLDLLIYVDCGEINRPGDIGEVFRKRAKKTINIDHHKTNDYFADFNYVFPNMSSTCEIVFNLFREFNFEISKEVADALLVGINTDTYRFLYQSSGASTLRVCAELYDLGADKDFIYQQLYQNKNFEVEMFKNKLINRAKLFFNNKVAIIGMFKADFEGTDLTMDMVDDIVNYYRDINGFEVSVLFKELEDNLFKGSVRSKEFVDVSKICKYFNGGGHTRSSGCVIEGDFDFAVNSFLEKLKSEYPNEF
ncbi:DHHA1 domain protein [Parvimonas sp. KA00067]|uniref:DHH family phosphoesterase n=1 Tax=Parvimonas sp. KA00067 TaxID=1588755 RepID=UPI00079499F5|nr:bifunctional oligoribonuclease/PAP phosphatase NrnA [Parvimonas sp. KA00067]KXB67475.1 DHHA1 domain protein [Parvimonas sp. KA00067]